MRKIMKKKYKILVQKIMAFFLLFVLPLVSAYHPGTDSGRTVPTTIADPGGGPYIAIIVFVLAIAGWVYWKIKNRG